MNIRPTTTEDIPDLQLVLDRTELFPSEMLPEMLNASLEDKNSQDIWLTCELDAKAVGFSYAVPEQLAEGTWNMLAIAVLPEKQGNGIGGAIVEALEAKLKKMNQRILIVDTSGTDDFANTREFYRKQSYTEEARIRDFWADGDDKITFWKSLR